MGKYYIFIIKSIFIYMNLILKIVLLFLLITFFYIGHKNFKMILKKKTNLNEYNKLNKQFDNNNATEIVDSFFDIATEFYEYGWGQSFHFANRYKLESFKQGIIRYEHELALRLGIFNGANVMDLGSGVAGPLRNIAKLTRANITGITCNKYQVNKSNNYIKNEQLGSKCKVILGDYLETPFKNNSMDFGYEIEASAHCTDLNKFFREVYRTLKPNSQFAGYAWCITPKYNPNNKKDDKILEDIKYGNGLPHIYSFQDFKNAIKKSGLVLEFDEDFALRKDMVPWYEPLSGNTLSNIKSSKLGRNITANLLFILETLKLAKSGTCKAHKMLLIGADGLLKAGETGIYTPMHFYRVRKP